MYCIIRFKVWFTLFLITVKVMKNISINTISSPDAKGLNLDFTIIYSMYITFTCVLMRIMTASWAGNGPDLHRVRLRNRFLDQARGDPVGKVGQLTGGPRGQLTGWPRHQHGFISIVRFCTFASLRWTTFSFSLLHFCLLQLIFTILSCFEVVFTWLTHCNTHLKTFKRDVRIFYNRKRWKYGELQNTRCCAKPDSGWVRVGLKWGVCALARWR